MPQANPDDLPKHLRVRALTALVAVVAGGCATAVAQQKPLTNARHIAPQPASNAEGTGSTPGVLAIPQMGSVSFRCDRAFRAQPFFSTHGSTNGDDLVTVRAGETVRRNFVTRDVHQGGRTLHVITMSSNPTVALPYAHYGLVTFAIHEGSEARILDAKASAEFVAGRFKHNRVGACYVRRWLLSLTVH
jgi:hypothetical protein